MKTKLLRRLRKKANRKYYLAKYKNEYYFQIREMSMFSEWGKVNEKIALKKLREIYIHPYLENEILKLKEKKAKRV